VAIGAWRPERRANPGRASVALVIALVSLIAVGARLSAQAPPPLPPFTALLNATPAAESYTFTYFNRPIVVLKAIVLGRSPAERASGMQHALDELVAQHVTGPVEYRLFDGGAFVTVGSRVVLTLATADVDNLSGETVPDVSAQAVAQLSRALEEVAEAHRPRLLLRGAVLALLALLLGAAALWAIARLQRRLIGRLAAAAEKTAAGTRLGGAEVLQGIRFVDLEHRLVAGSMLALDLLVVYWVLTFSLRQFPYTRPWGESLRGFLLATLQNLGLGVLHAMPGLFTVAIIVLITRFLVRIVSVWFTAVERGRVTARWLYPETAQTTRRLLSTLLWLFAIVVAYPYLPGSGTDAFKGVSVFLGLIVSLGSSGVVSQLMSGFMITYSRALRLGDFVRIGDVEGTVIHLGLLSTKLKTLRNEEVTIPNAVVVSQTTTDYSRNADTDGVFTPTAVTIGYDAPWRQVHAMLLQAAERTGGIRRQPKPVVLQASLDDFYVKYTLWVSLEHQNQRPLVFNMLHANIQDVFNEYGVQIMSPNYVLDPAAPKVVAKKDWFTAPAPPSSQS
jgi:small-conductance mechanosensitive channel